MDRDLRRSTRALIVVVLSVVDLLTL